MPKRSSRDIAESSTVHSDCPAMPICHTPSVVAHTHPPLTASSRRPLNPPPPTSPPSPHLSSPLLIPPPNPSPELPTPCPFPSGLVSSSPAGSASPPSCGPCVVGCCVPSLSSS